ncbi:hypothetical protein [Candidatus Rhabdochlamydia porcellionis]|jgi:hypothetical protein|uniref:LPS export ABC transporter periplasmic protein LptC n=1 Tax=Candidatus Rhabdochlamydia porcellionis TaxID=225148 RepID=A0ABX8Z0K2_9BACT|nr:hypothetical protein [Candidatus Rhabdochlamydia porcellionis]QZA59189.1 hypothetical protein RHAB15C_0001074 [Candidatus Rhabdochlamydia porcellionis]
MLKQATSIGCMLLVITMLTWGWFFLRVRPVDRFKVLSLLERQIQSKTDFSSANQTRLNVTKDIWLTQDNNSRLHHRIASRSSLLVLKPNEGKFKLIEELDQINCLMQERIYYSNGVAMQQVRLLEANSGQYHFSEKQLLSQGVSISVYKLNTHTLPQEIFLTSPIFSGNAENISMIISGKTPELQAKGFIAQMYPKD